MDKSFLESLVQFVTAAFGLAAGLAWNGAIQTIIKTYLPSDASTIIGQLIYAIVLTLIAVLVTRSLSRIKPKK